MATLIPPLNGCLGRMTRGEKRLARLLESHLEDDYLCWYEPRVGVGARARYTDFVVLHANRGLLLLEVKDWKLENLRRFDRDSVELLTDTGLKHVQNPLAQARQCTLRLVDALERDPALRRTDGPHAGKIVCPWTYGVVLTEIGREEFERHELGAVLPEHLVVCRDEMVASIDAEAFQTRLWNMFPARFPVRMTLPQIDRVRWHLFPEIRVEAPVQGSLLEAADDESPIDMLFPDIVRVMDVRQERLARGLGSGHRVIHGVAGSGKTMILGYRCLHIAALVAKPILVLCFNVALAARLRELTAARGIGERVHVRSFHAWCDEQLRAYHVERPSSSGGAFDYAALVQRVIDATADGRIPRAQYGAVMIDEGHDFEPDWLRLVVGMIDPDNDSLLLLYDDAQSIYSARRELGFSLSSVGVQARGRTTVLRLNYRNTDEILAFAYRFARDWLAPDEADDDHVPLIEPESAGRHGPDPVVRRLGSFDEEARLIALAVRRQHEQGLPWADMGVFYRDGWMGERIARELAAADVPLHWLRTAADKRRLSQQEASVKLMTMHSSKGLEFPFVAVAGVGAMPKRQVDVAAEAKLLYVAMTRATEKLLVTGDRDSDFVARLTRA